MSTDIAGRRKVPTAPTSLLEEAIELAHRFGRDPEYARGGGGNVSVKHEGVLYIKPSGASLGALTPGDLVPLDVGPLLDLLSGTSEVPATAAEAPAGSDLVLQAAAAARLDKPNGRRPSVELLFHALLPERFVVHTHPVVVNTVACSRNGAALVERLFGDQALWIPYTDPGLPLARAIVAARGAFEERAGRSAPRVSVLQNHGIIVAADTTAAISDLSAWVVATVQAELERCSEVGDRRVAMGPPLDRTRVRKLIEVIGPSLRSLLADGQEALKVVTFDGSDIAAESAAVADGRAFVLGGPLTPDQIVYTRSWPLLFDVPPEADPTGILPLLSSSLQEHVRVRGEPPIVVVVPGVGLFAAGDSWREADTARHVYLDALRVGQGALALGGVRALEDEERAFIETWEAEAYRRSVASGAKTGGRFQGRVALVTGAAQGFGQAIAADLVAQGGHVVLADINVELATSSARDLEARFGPGRAMAVAMDVTDEQSVAEGLHATVEQYGGLDLLVSNAGVLRAGGVSTQRLADFDLVTSVNYRGFFLAVRFAAPIFACQHRARPEYWSDVVEINSKSGLVGSSRNSAYAGSKFGGVGLTQSFALELVGDGIKVNAICPGNYLDGPLWSDPENGLFVQYLRAGKVPGAKTVEDVRRSYESRVPMGRGCTPSDVLEALYYVIAQKYETGQALPVTGGQVMLS